MHCAGQGWVNWLPFSYQMKNLGSGFFDCSNSPAVIDQRLKGLVTIPYHRTPPVKLWTVYLMVEGLTVSFDSHQIFFTKWEARMLVLKNKFDKEVRKKIFKYEAPMCAAYVKKWLEMIAMGFSYNPNMLNIEEIASAQQKYQNRPRGPNSKKLFWTSMSGLNVNWQPKKNCSPNQVIKAIEGLSDNQGLVIRFGHKGPYGEKDDRRLEMHAVAVYRHPTGGILFFNPGHALFEGKPKSQPGIIGIDIWYYISHRYKVQHKTGIFINQVERIR